MLRIKNWSIRARLFLAFGGILTIFVALTSVGVVMSHGIRQGLSTIEEETALDLKHTATLELSWDQLVMALRAYMVTGDFKDGIQIERYAAQFEAAFRSLAATPSEGVEERQVIEALGSIASDVKARIQGALAAPHPPTHRDMRAMAEALIRLSGRIEPLLQRLKGIHLSEIDVLVQHASDLSYQTEIMTFAAVFLGAVGGGALSILFSHWLSRPIMAIAQGSRRLAEGDLSQRVEVSSGGELGEAARAFNVMAERLEQSAVENARLYDAARQRANRIAAVNRLNKIVSASLDIGAVYETFAGELKRFISFTRMGIVISEDSGTKLKLFQLVGNRLDEVPVGMIWSNGRGSGVEWVMSNRRPYFEQDLAKARRFVEDGALLKEGIRSTVRLPLIATGQVIGVLFLDDVAPGRYTERDLEVLVPLGEQLAIAIENARLHGEMERKVEERTKKLKDTQAQLIQSGKLAAVGTLAAGVAHELNQPLMIARGYAQELLWDQRITDEEIRDDLRRIEAQTDRMSAIINHLRDFSRESAGRRQVTDLNRVVKDALTFLGQQLKTRNIAVTQELHPALPSVWADPLRIEQVLLNLITNARDAMEGAGLGTITIRTGVASGSRVALSVTDTGPGIPGEIRTRIFDPFFTTKEVGKGTGLGLSICHGIVQEHGGELTMDSPVADGKGARFTMVLPQAVRDDNTGDRT